MSKSNDQKFMRLALAEAKKALREGEVPIGAVAVRLGRIVARGHNRRNSLRDLTAHAEVMCLRDLSRREGLGKNLAGVTVYSTLEPCAMCSGAMIHHRVGRCVWGEGDTLLGAAGGALDILNRKAGRVRQTGGVLRKECRALLLAFFEKELGRPATAWEDIRLPND